MDNPKPQQAQVLQSWWVKPATAIVQLAARLGLVREERVLPIAEFIARRGSRVFVNGKRIW